jgi:hypothetical protein
MQGNRQIMKTFFKWLGISLLAIIIITGAIWRKSG